MNLVKKFETRTARVKGVCFHPTRPWVITSLHSGIIQIWDYNMNIVLATFDVLPTLTVGSRGTRARGRFSSASAPVRVWV